MAGVIHDGDKERFRTEDGAAFLEYRKKEVGEEKTAVLDLEHTYVPPSKRGCGVAAELCKAAFSYAKENGYQVIPTCSYISETFLPRHPQLEELVIQRSSL